MSEISVVNVNVNVNVNGAQITADNDSNYYDVPRVRRAIVFQEIELLPGVTVQELADALNDPKRTDGRDQILVEFKTPAPDGRVRFGILAADEFENLDDVTVHGPVMVNGEEAVVRGINDEDEDGVGKYFYGYFEYALGGLAYLAGGICIGTPEPTTLTKWLGLGYIAAGTVAIATGKHALKDTELDEKPSNLLSGLARPSVKLPGLGGGR